MPVEDSINDLNNVLDVAVGETVTDGNKTKYDLDLAERRLVNLKRRYWKGQGHSRNPIFSQPLRVTGGGE